MIKRFDEIDKDNEIKSEGCCYIYIRGNDINIEHYYDLVDKSKSDEMILYPEDKLTFAKIIDYRPYVLSIVTENPFIISTYDIKHVFVLSDDKWIHPEFQTYGTSVEIIRSELLHYDSSIPSAIIDGGKYINKIKNMKNYI